MHHKWDLRSFFPPPSVEPLALSFGSMSLTRICDFFLLMVFMSYDDWSSISFVVLVFIFLLSLFWSFALLVLVLCWFYSLYRLTFFLLPLHDFLWIRDFGWERVKVQLGHMRIVLKRPSLRNMCCIIYWILLMEIWTMWTIFYLRIAEL